MNFRTVLFSSLALAGLVILCGCAEFEYTGREFAPVPNDVPIAWYTNSNPVPPGKYRIIGRGELIFNIGDLDAFDIEERLIDEARKRGADAVMIVSQTVKQVGNYEADAEMLPDAAAALEPQSAIMPDGSRAEINSFGEIVPLNGESGTLQVVYVRALFYKNSQAVQKLIDEQSVQLLELEKKSPEK